MYSARDAGDARFSVRRRRPAEHTRVPAEDFLRAAAFAGLGDVVQRTDDAESGKNLRPADEFSDSLAAEAGATPGGRLRRCQKRPAPSVAKSSTCSIETTDKR